MTGKIMTFNYYPVTDEKVHKLLGRYFPVYHAKKYVYTHTDCYETEIERHLLVYIPPFSQNDHVCSFQLRFHQRNLTKLDLENLDKLIKKNLYKNPYKIILQKDGFLAEMIGPTDAKIVKSIKSLKKAIKFLKKTFEEIYFIDEFKDKYRTRKLKKRDIRFFQEVFIPKLIDSSYEELANTEKL